MGDSVKAFGESASRFDSLTSEKGGLSVVDENDEIFNENGDALKRSMNPFAKPSKLIEKDFSSDSYSGDKDSINPDFRAKKDLGLNKMIDGDDGLQKLDEELQASIEDGFDPLSMSNDKKLDQVIGDDAKDRDLEDVTKKVEERAANAVKDNELEKTIEKNLANMSKEDLLKLAEQAKLGKKLSLT